MIPITYTNCQWIGHGEGCTCDTVPGRAYCETHLWRVYARGSCNVRQPQVERATAAIHTWESIFTEAVEELHSEGEL